MRYLRNLWVGIGLVLIGAFSASAEVQIAKIHYLGWADSYYLTNGTVEVVVVPAIGRVMRFAFVGGENPLWENQAWLGKTRADAREDEWANFGGDKNWTAPQSDWPKYLGRSWPPDFAFDGFPYQAKVLDGKGLQITSPVSEATGLRVIRRLTLEETGARLRIHQIFEKVRGEPCDVSIWSITQVRDADALYMPLGSRGELIPLSKQLVPEHWQVEGNWVRVTRDPNKPAKAGATSERAWLAWVKGDLIFRILGAYEPQATYPDGGCNLEIYTSADPLDYAELELLSPMRTYRVGDRHEYPITWELKRLPEAATPAQIREALEMTAER